MLYPTIKKKPNNPVIILKMITNLFNPNPILFYKFPTLLYKYVVKFCVSRDRVNAHVEPRGTLTNK